MRKEYSIVTILITELICLGLLILFSFILRDTVLQEYIFWTFWTGSILLTVKSIFHIKKLKKEMLEALSGERFEKKSFEYILRLLTHRSTEAIDKEVRATIANTRAEISALQNQINPHFLYNTLDTIRGQALIDGAPVVADMAEALSHIFRYSISNSDQLVTLQAEMRNIGQYIMIQKFRFEDKFKIEIHYEENELIYCYIPKLTLQPIVENAIYHGLETIKSGGIIEIYIYATSGRLIISIQDNGKGMTVKQLNEINSGLRYQYSIIRAHGNRHTGVGLVNIHQRIQLLFGKEYGLVLQSAQGKGTQVEVILPQITDREYASWKQRGDIKV